MSKQMSQKTNLESVHKQISLDFIQYRLPIVFGVIFLIIFLITMILMTYLVNENQQFSELDRIQFTALTEKIMTAGVVAIVIAIIVLIVYSHFKITAPILNIKDRAEEIANGNYDSVDTISPKRNELGLLADSISELALKVKDSNATMESEKQRLDSVLTHMSDGVIATNRRGNVILINDAALNLLDKTREEVMDKSVMDVFEIRKKYSYRQLLETKDELILSVVSDGETSIIRGEFSVIKRESGFISGIVCVLSDITEQEKVEQERRDFVSNVSHELRTPLTSMRSYTESLIDGAWQDDTLAPQFLSVIQSETDRMIRMVSDLLNLSRLDSVESNPLKMDVVDMTNLLNQVFNRYELLLKSEDYRNKTYQLEKDFPQSAYWVEGDEDRLVQVVDNIINNAIKYSPDGGKIICRLIETNQQIVISISDEGLGIPKKSIPHLFKRFYRVDKARSREQGGTGLGLAIAKEVIELHKGKIWVSSKEHNGSTFFIALPKLSYEDDWL